MYFPLSTPGALIRRLHQISACVVASKADAFGLTTVQFGAPQVISDRPGIGQASLTEAADIDRTTAVRVIDRLAESGLIRRTVCADDRSVRRLRITGADTQLIVAMELSAEVSQTLLLRPLSAAERKQLLDMLRRLVASHARQDRTLHGSSCASIF
jgi:DNA-binding MarR family transcriptional regulator